MAIYAWEGHIPHIDPTAFVHPEAVVIGQVVIGPASSIWPGVIVRGDVNRIEIGAGSNVQDLSVLHVSRPTPERPEGAPLIIGDGVTVGHNVILHGCWIQSDCLIGMGAIIMDGVVVGEGAMVGAGSLIPPGKHIAPGMLWLGSPAKPQRQVTPGEFAQQQATAANYQRLALQHRQTLRRLPEP